MKKYVKRDLDSSSRKWYVIEDRQGSDFGMYRLYTADQWLEQAIEWMDSDGEFDDDSEDAYSEEEYRQYWKYVIDRNPQDFIDYLADMWQITLVEQGVDGHDFYTEFPEDDTPYGYYR